MFLTTPCNLPNSESKIPLRVQANTLFDLEWAANAFQNGNTALYDLIDALGGNSPYSNGGSAGVPTLGPFGGKPPALQWGGPGAAVAKLPSSNNGGCIGAPAVLPLLTVLPIADFTLPPPAVKPKVITVPVAPAAAPAAVAPDTSICNFTPETVCAAARAGCFAAGQVDPRQLAACASSGWAGNENRFPALVARGGWNGGAPVGFINQSPRYPDGRAASGGGVGMNGLDETGNHIVAAVVAGSIIAGATWLLKNMPRVGGRR